MRSLRSRLARLRQRRPPWVVGDGAEHLLVTGAGGTIGRILREGLADGYVVHGIDIAPGPGVDWVADMTRLEQIAPAFEGMSAVVDLAAASTSSASWALVRENNIPAILNTLEAAHRAGVKRVVFASSNHVVGQYELDEPYASIAAGRYDGLEPTAIPRLGADAPMRPDGPYGVGKALGEVAGRYYAEVHGLSVLCLRIGTVNRADEPQHPRHYATLLSHRDLVHLVRCCLEAPASPSFGVFYGVSANTWRFWDIDAARKVIGYVPQDNTERFR